MILELLIIQLISSCLVPHRLYTNKVSKVNLSISAQTCVADKSIADQLSTESLEFDFADEHMMANNLVEWVGTNSPPVEEHAETNRLKDSRKSSHSDGIERTFLGKHMRDELSVKQNQHELYSNCWHNSSYEVRVCKESNRGCGACQE